MKEQGSVPSYNMGQEETERIEFSNDMFHIKSMDELIQDPKNFSPIRPLLGQWGYEKEIVVIGGNTNTGKSIFASDVGFACCSGTSWWPGRFSTELNEKVLLIDSEMTDQQFANRYKNVTINPNFLRATFWQTKYHGDELQDFIYQLENVIKKPDGPRVIIVDNISTISSMVSPTAVLNLISKLKSLKDDYECTLIIVTHTNKTSETKPLSLNDFRGSKIFMNMADTVIGIGNTIEGKDTKYIKLMKSRNTAIPDTVSLVRIADEPYLHMEYLDEVYESQVLGTGKKRGPSPCITPMRAEKILEMYACGLSLRAIGNNMGLGKSTIQRFLSEHEANVNNPSA